MDSISTAHISVREAFLKGRWVVTIWLHLPYQKVASLLQLVTSTKSVSYEIKDGGPPERLGAKHGLDDAQRGGRWRHRGGRDSLVVGPEFLQGADQAVRLANHASAGSVRGVLALARNAELQKSGRDGRQNQHQNSSHTAAFALVVGSTKPQADVTKVGDGAGDSRGNRANQDIVVAHVRKLVGDDALEFVIRH